MKTADLWEQAKKILKGLVIFFVFIILINSILESDEVFKSLFEFLLAVSVIGTGFFVFKKIRNKQENSVEEVVIYDVTDEVRAPREDPWFERYQQLYNLRQPYYDSLSESERLYSVVYNSKDYFGQNANALIQRCKSEIKYFVETSNLDKEVFRGVEPTSSFYHLARIYELRKDYQNALEICNYAMLLGYKKDGTKGGFPGRYERMRRKLIETRRM